MSDNIFQLLLYVHAEYKYKYDTVLVVSSVVSMSD